MTAQTPVSPAYGAARPARQSVGAWSVWTGESASGSPVTNDPGSGPPRGPLVTGLPRGRGGHATRRCRSSRSRSCGERFRRASTVVVSIHHGGGVIVQPDEPLPGIPRVPVRQVEPEEERPVVVGAIGPEHRHVLQPGRPEQPPPGVRPWRAGRRPGGGPSRTRRRRRRPGRAGRESRRDDPTGRTPARCTTAAAARRDRSRRAASSPPRRPAVLVGERHRLPCLPDSRAAPSAPPRSRASSSHGDQVRVAAMSSATSRAGASRRDAPRSRPSALRHRDRQAVQEASFSGRQELLADLDAGLCEHVTSRDQRDRAQHAAVARVPVNQRPPCQRRAAQPVTASPPCRSSAASTVRCAGSFASALARHVEPWEVAAPPWAVRLLAGRPRPARRVHPDRRDQPGTVRVEGRGLYEHGNDGGGNRSAAGASSTGRPGAVRGSPVTDDPSGDPSRGRIVTGLPSPDMTEETPEPVRRHVGGAAGRPAEPGVHARGAGDAAELPGRLPQDAGHEVRGTHARAAGHGERAAVQPDPGRAGAAHGGGGAELVPAGDGTRPGRSPGSTASSRTATPTSPASSRRRSASTRRSRRWPARSRTPRSSSRRTPDLGVTGTHDDGEIELRDVLVHMIEEYARHCGHADLLRECIDGRTGQ